MRKALETIRRYDELLEDLAQADRVKLSYAIRQTLKRITLRREIRVQKPYRVVRWTGTLELHDQFGENAPIQLTDEVPSTGGRRPGTFASAAIRCSFVKWWKASAGASRFLSQAVLAGKLENFWASKSVGGPSRKLFCVVDEKHNLRAPINKRLFEKSANGGDLEWL